MSRLRSSKPGKSANLRTSLPPVPCSDGPLCLALLPAHREGPVPTLPYIILDSYRTGEPDGVYLKFLFPPGCSETLGEVLIHG